MRQRSRITAPDVSRVWVILAADMCRFAVTKSMKRRADRAHGEIEARTHAPCSAANRYNLVTRIAFVVLNRRQKLPDDSVASRPM